MSGFIRGTQPAALDRASVARFVAQFVAEEFLPDPFEIAHDCLNPSGHVPIPSYGEIVCFHCARIFWR